MKRSIRQVPGKRKIIIFSSDSEDEPADVSNDENYVPTKAPQKKRKTITNSTKRTVSLSENSKQITTKLGRKKIKTELIDNTNESVDLNKKTQNKNAKMKKEEIKNSDAGNIKQILKDISLKSTELKEWTVEDYVSKVNSIEKHIAENVIKLFDNENTIPFIARYRRDMTGGMEPDKLRAVKQSFDHAKVIKQRANTILKSIDKLGQWSPAIHSAVVSAKSLDDLEHIYSFFKPTSKRTLAERAKELGLGSVSDFVLQGQTLPPLSSFIDSTKDGLKTEQQIIDGIVHIIADIINKNKTVFDKVKELQSKSVITIQVTECKTNSKSADSKEKDVHRKYETYYDFNANTNYIKPHQILAINRGEAQKFLNVKMTIPEFFEKEFKAHCYKQYNAAITASKLHSKLLNDSINYAYTKLIKPLVVRRVRSEMKQKAETASIEVFVTNVKQLLLTPPVRGKTILAIDPGFSHGCKLAVISEQGDVLKTGVIYPHTKEKESYNKSADVLVALVTKYKATVLALGNATACRETEMFLNKLIKSNVFGSIEVSYTIVNEAGASIYSCSPEAKSEFPDLDTNLISAISIARRLQDPLAELVKVEPKHLGVGMYQHDLPEKQLLVALNEVVSEVVSFVGVDVNTASKCLLRRVAGLNASRANNIIEWRSEFGPFKNRQQLLDVKGIGNKVFEQCAGFIRILPETSMNDNSKKRKPAKKSEQTYNLLDQSWIHPESYKIAERFLKYCNCNMENFGTTEFIEKVKSCADEGFAGLAQQPENLVDINNRLQNINVNGRTNIESTYGSRNVGSNYTETHASRSRLLDGADGPNTICGTDIDLIHRRSLNSRIDNSPVRMGVREAPDGEEGLEPQILTPSQHLPNQVIRTMSNNSLPDSGDTHLLFSSESRNAENRESGTNISSEIRIPEWISRPRTPLCVVFNDRALIQLNEILGTKINDQKIAIENVLREDPRSVYLRQRWGSQFYTFLIHDLHITCRFDDSRGIVTVFQVRHAGRICECGEPEWQCLGHSPPSS